MRSPPPYRDLSTTLRDLGVAHGDRLAAQELRARVRRALATFQAAGASRVQERRSERQQIIITRCDLGGELHKVVAANLGISMRTLYRDRTDGFRRLRHALSAEPVEAPVGVTRDGVALRIERAWEQILLGKTREAIVRLEEITASASPALLSIAYARLAAARYLAKDDVRSSDALSRAKRALSVLGPSAASTVAEAEIGIVETLQLQSEGAFERAVHAYDRIVTMLQVHAPNAVDTVRLALAGRIEAHLARGDTLVAFELAKAACSDPSHDVLASARSEPATALALAECALLWGGDAAVVRSDALAAGASASANGMALLAARALRIAAQAMAELFDVAGALAHLREAVATMRELPEGRPRIALILELGASFAELGDAERALMLMKALAIAPQRCDFTAGVVRRVEAESLLALRHHAEAAVRAREAVRILTAFESRRALGEALLTSACAAAACGDLRASRAAATQSLPLLTGATWPSRLERARRLAARRRSRRGFTAMSLRGIARAG